MLRNTTSETSDRLIEHSQPPSNITIDMCPRSRGAMRPSCAETLSLEKQRAQGMPGARCARSRACSVVNTRVSHHGHTGKHPALSLHAVSQWIFPREA